MRDGTLMIENGVVRLAGKGLFRIVPGRCEQFKAYRIQHNQARGPQRRRDLRRPPRHRRRPDLRSLRGRHRPA
jgi:hypothetical protein